MLEKERREAELFRSLHDKASARAYIVDWDDIQALQLRAREVGLYSERWGPQPGGEEVDWEQKGYLVIGKRRDAVRIVMDEIHRGHQPVHALIWERLRIYAAAWRAWVSPEPDIFGRTRRPWLFRFLHSRSPPSSYYGAPRASWNNTIELVVLGLLGLLAFLLCWEIFTAMSQSTKFLWGTHLSSVA